MMMMTMTATVMTILHYSVTTMMMMMMMMFRVAEVTEAVVARIPILMRTETFLKETVRGCEWVTALREDVELRDWRKYVCVVVEMRFRDTDCGHEEEEEVDVLFRGSCGKRICHTRSTAGSARTCL